MTNLGFSGTREGTTEFQFEAIKCIISDLNFKYFYQGCCVGADTQVTVEIAKLNKYIIGHPPTNPRYLSLLARALSHEIVEPQSYFRRNRAIVNHSNLLLAAPKSSVEDNSGTWYTINYAKKLSIPCVIIDQLGVLTYV